MASRQEDLRIIYPAKVTPERFGSHFNERPQPDALGRLPATPLEIQRAMNREFNLPPQQNLTNKEGWKGKVTQEWERLKHEREQRKASARATRRR